MSIEKVAVVEPAIELDILLSLCKGCTVTIPPPSGLARKLELDRFVL